MLLSLIPFNVLDGMYKIAAAGVFGVFISYLSWRNLKYVKTLGTSTVGAFMLTKGIGAFEGNFPHLLENIQYLKLDDPELQEVMVGNFSYIHMAYFIAWVLFAIIGACVQIKVTCKKEALDGKINGEFSHFP